MGSRTRTEIVVCKVSGDIEFVAEVLSNLEDFFGVVRQSHIKPNENDAGVHAFLTLAREVEK